MLAAGKRQAGPARTIRNRTGLVLPIYPALRGMGVLATWVGGGVAWRADRVAALAMSPCVVSAAEAQRLNADTLPQSMADGEGFEPPRP